MVYRINGRKVSKEEFFARKGTPIQAGDTFGVYGATSFEAFVSPIDGTVINSKQQIREHEAKHGVVHTGTDLLNTGNHGNTRQQDIEIQKGGNHDGTD